MSIEKIMPDVKKELDACLHPEYYGSLTVRFNIQGGKIRNVNYTPERSKKYE